MEKLGILMGVLLFVALLTIIYKWFNNKREKKQELITKFLSKYDLTLSNMIMCHCQYIGGHPERDRESNVRAFILFGAKNGKLIFFEGKEILESLGGTDGMIMSYKNIDSDTECSYLFDIPINSIVDIRYFDATTSNIVGGIGTSIGGIGIGIPIRMKHGDASVLVDWSDGRFTHSTEFRFVGSFKGRQANERANSLRNTLIRMTK